MFSVCIGTTIFLPLFKRIFKFRETTIIIIAGISSALRSTAIGFATQTWHMYAANAIGLFGGMVQPAVVSFIVQIVPAEEIGRAFTLFGIAADAAFIVTNVVYNNVYKLTVSWMPGFMFFFIGFVEIMCVLSVVWVHFMSIKERVGQTRRDTCRTVS